MKIKKDLYIPISILASGVLISFSIYYSLTSILNPNSKPTSAPNTNSAQTNLPTGTNEVLGDTTISNVTLGNDLILGNKDAKVTLLEFTDYQCPFCERYFKETFSQIKKDYVDTGKVKLVVKDYPLSFHPNASKAAEASECAKNQNKFWEFHDALFIKQQEWANLDNNGVSNYFKNLSGGLGVDQAKFSDCLDKSATKAEVDADIAEGNKAGVDGTPAFFLTNGDAFEAKTSWQKIVGAQPYSKFKTVIDGLLN